MIAIAIISAVSSVWQTYISNVVGQQVMHDLRAAVYHRLQRMSLAFFTKTRTGEVQSRIANDIGGLDNVVTTTATTIAQNATTVIAAIIAMCLLDWRLALISLVFVPLFVWLTRARRQDAPQDHHRAAAPACGPVRARRGVAVGVGDHARQDDGPRRRPRRPLHRRVQGHRRPRGALAHGGPLADVDDPDDVRDPAGDHLLACGPELRRPLDLDRDGRRVHDAADAAAVPDPVAARRRRRRRGVAGAVRPDLRVHGPADRYRRGRPIRSSCSRARLLGEVRFEDVWFRYGADDDGSGRCRGSISSFPPGRAPRSSARPARARRRSVTSSRACTSRSAAGLRSTGSTSAGSSLASLAATVGVVSQETYLFHASVRENLRFARPEATDAEIEEAARTARIHDLIASLPDGYDTIVGERGYRFSGGEKQRMAIARTVLRNPPVLVLDEATSSLDTQTEAAVQAELERLVRGAHDDHDRPSPLDGARRGPDRRARRRPDRGARHARGAAGRGRPLRGARLSRRRGRTR